MRSFLTALGLNAVPAAGWFIDEWSAGTMLVLYWLETLIGTLLVGIRIVILGGSGQAKGKGTAHRAVVTNYFFASSAKSFRISSLCAAGFTAM